MPVSRVHGLGRRRWFRRIRRRRRGVRVRIPENFSSQEAAPLLCAGIIGYRALRRAELPPGGRLGIWGFGGSAHLAAQVALAAGAEVHVRTRGEAARQLARELGAASVGDSFDPVDVPARRRASCSRPAGELVPAALETLDRGATLVVAGIYLSDIPQLNYEKHLFQERSLRSVTANTRADGEAFLQIAARIPMRVTTTPYPRDQAPQALATSPPAVSTAPPCCCPAESLNHRLD